MQESKPLAILAALSFVVALQLGGVKNDTSPVQGNVSSSETPMPNGDPNFWFALAGAIGSLATAAGFGVIFYQTRLTKKQIAQTQEELDNTLRPWIGAPEISYSSDKKELLIKLKNFGHFPGRITALKAKDSESRPNRNDIASGYANRTEITLFPEHERSYTVSATGEALPFVGFVVEYVYGTEGKKGLYGVIYQYSPPNRFAIEDEWFE